MNISMIRHGKTPGNLRGAFVGSVDQPLAPEGRKALELLAERGGYPAVQAVFVSPMLRCVQTAQILYPGHELIRVENLRERHFGDFEGLTHEEIIKFPGNSDWGMDPNAMDFPGGEEAGAFNSRCADAFGEAVARCVREKMRDVAFVVHGGVIMAVMARFGRPKRDYHGWMCRNGEGYLTRWDRAENCLIFERQLQSDVR